MTQVLNSGQNCFKSWFFLFWQTWMFDLMVISSSNFLLLSKNLDQSRTWISVEGWQSRCSKQASPFAFSAQNIKEDTHSIVFKWCLRNISLLWGNQDTWNGRKINILWTFDGLRQRHTIHTLATKQMSIISPLCLKPAGQDCRCEFPNFNCFSEPLFVFSGWKCNGVTA